MLRLGFGHKVQELVLPPELTVGVHAGDLADAKVVAGDMELLEVAEQQLLHGLVLRGGGGEDLLPQLVQGDAGDVGHPLRHPPVPGGAGGGFEHDGVGDDGGGHEPRQLGGGHEAPLLVHPRHDGGGAAHRLVADVDGVLGLDVRQAVVVDDGQDVRLLQAGDGLGGLVVVHQHHLLAAGADQVVAGEGPHHPAVGVQDGVAAVAALEDHLPHVVDVVLQPEELQIIPLGDAADGDGLEDPPDRAVAVIGGGDDAGAFGHLPDVVGELRLAEDHAADPKRHRLPEELRLVAADEHRLLLPVGGQVRALRQGQDHLAGDGVDHLAGLREELALQGAEDVEDGHLPQGGVGDGVHVVAGDVPGGEHALEVALVVGDGDGGDVLVLLHGGPGPVDGDGLVEDGGLVVVQVQHLGADVFEVEGRLKAEAGEDGPGLVAELAQPGGHILPVPHGVAQGGVGHGGDNGVGVRVAVSGDVDLVHRLAPYRSTGAAAQ